MRRSWHHALAATLAVLAGNAAATAAPDPLAQHRGTARVLILSAPDASDRHLAAQRAAAAAAQAGYRERDLVVVDAIGAGADAVVLRRRFGLPADAFRAVLVGKDGGVKIVAAAPIASRDLFGTIDAMPMRRDEMDRRP